MALAESICGHWICRTRAFHFGNLEISGSFPAFNGPSLHRAGCPSAPYVKVAAGRPKVQDAGKVQAWCRTSGAADSFIGVSTKSLLEWRPHRRHGNGSRRRDHSRCAGAILRWREDNHRCEGAVRIAVRFARDDSRSGRSAGLQSRNREGYNSGWTGRARQPSADDRNCNHKCGGAGRCQRYG
jgi:hypothetical protein